MKWEERALIHTPFVLTWLFFHYTHHYQEELSENLTCVCVNKLRLWCKLSRKSDLQSLWDASPRMEEAADLKRQHGVKWRMLVNVLLSVWDWFTWLFGIIFRFYGWGRSGISCSQFDELQLALIGRESNNWLRFSWWCSCFTPKHVLHVVSSGSSASRLSSPPPVILSLLSHPPSLSPPLPSCFCSDKDLCVKVFSAMPPEYKQNSCMLWAHRVKLYGWGVSLWWTNTQSRLQLR